MHHKEVRTPAHVFVQIPASRPARPGTITSKYCTSTTSGSNAIQPTVVTVRYTEIPCVLESFVAKMQFSLSFLAILAASASVVTASPPRRYDQPVQYGNLVPWTSSTCSAVYSTIKQTSTKAVPTVVTTTVWKPSTWTSTQPTIITSVYTTFKPATTVATSTVTSTFVGKRDR
jgi:hypothetical protein